MLRLMSRTSISIGIDRPAKPSGLWQSSADYGWLCSRWTIPRPERAHSKGLIGRGAVYPREIRYGANFLSILENFGGQVSKSASLDDRLISQCSFPGEAPPRP